MSSEISTSQNQEPSPTGNTRTEQRGLKKLLNQERLRQEEEARSRILPRSWLQFQHAPDGYRQCKVMTWNLLAQCLVRRDLFPTSDCLKATEREHMLYRDILSHAANVCCLQEVDRTEKLLPVLERAGYDYVYVKGPFKKHGCLIAFQQNKLVKCAEKGVFYDEQEVRDMDEGNRTRRGTSFHTKNVANLVALRWVDSDDDGIVVATTHLFWHPAYTYERARQAGILMREVSKFRHSLGRDNWPCIIAGDFNFPPDDPAYSLLVGDPLLPDQSTRLSTSRVVHVSVDPNVPIITSKGSMEDEGGSQQDTDTDPDRVIVNAREAVKGDGLLEDEELQKLFQDVGTAFSVYDLGLSSNQTPDPGLLYGSRAFIPLHRQGRSEPVWTSYTHHWKSVLDYIFVLNPNRGMRVTGLAAPHPAESLEPGLPRKGVCASDHISLCAELAWTP